MGKGKQVKEAGILLSIILSFVVYPSAASREVLPAVRLLSKLAHWAIY